MAKQKDRNVCFNCGGYLVWDNDFNFEDVCRGGDGIAHFLHCNDCGAEVTYYVSFGEDDE